MGQSSALTESQNRSLYTLAGYLLILLMLLIAALALGSLAHLLVIRSGWMPSDESIVKWVGMVMFTPATFGWVIKRSKRYWRVEAFWTAVVCLLVVHVGCFLALFAFIANWRFFWFFVICVFEVPLIEGLATKMAKRLPNSLS